MNEFYDRIVIVSTRKNWRGASESRTQRTHSSTAAIFPSAKRDKYVFVSVMHAARASLLITGTKIKEPPRLSLVTRSSTL